MLNLTADFREFLELLNSNGVEYLIVGGYAVAQHGAPRYTGDIDIWMAFSKRNAETMIKSLQEFGFASLGVKTDDLAKADVVLQLGHPPFRIDILTSVTGLEFDDCYKERLMVDNDGLIIPFVSLRNLKINKAATGRAKDIADLEELNKNESD